MKNIKGFLMLVVLSLTVPVVGTTAPEILNLIANHKDYIGASIILLIGFIATLIGSIAYGILKDEIK